MKKRFFNSGVILVAFIMIFLVIATSCNGGGGNFDPNKSHLFVWNMDGGIGREWLDRVIERFKEEYKNEEFEPGKKGVEVWVTAKKGNPSSTIASDKNEVFFGEKINYNDLIVQNRLLEITDIVKEKLPGEDKSIEDKLSPEKITALTALNGKHYVLPHYEIYPGLTYDVDLFEEESLYFDIDGKFTNYFKSYDEDPEKSNLSPGPDGVKGTYDDGLPATYEQFFDLCNRMKMRSIAPFAFSGMYPGYTNYLLVALWSKYCGAKEFMYNVTFDSGDDTTRVVTGFDSNGNPIIESRKVSPQTGYLASWQAGKYYALWFMEQMVKNIWYDLDTCDRGSVTHLDAQWNYIHSRFEQKPIAMLVEGSYWYNEAQSAIISAERSYPKARDRKLAWMPLPAVIDGTVDETNGVKNVVVDNLSSFAFINANIKDNPNKVRLAKTFLQYCYKEENLQDFMMTVGVPKGVDFELTSDQYDDLSYYQKSLYDIKRNSDVVFPFSNSNIFIQNTSNFLFDGNSSIYKSSVGSTLYGNFFYAAAKRSPAISAREYFEGMIITEPNWNEYLNS